MISHYQAGRIFPLLNYSKQHVRPLPGSHHQRALGGHVLKGWTSQSLSLATSLCKRTGCRAQEQRLLCLPKSSPGFSGCHSRGPFQAHVFHTRFSLSPTSHPGSTGVLGLNSSQMHIFNCARLCSQHQRRWEGLFISCLRRDTLPATLICSRFYSEM